MVKSMEAKGGQPTIVLHVVGRLDMGGAESRIMDIYRQIDRSRVQFYFAQHTRDRCFFEEEIEQLGGRILRIPRFNVKNILAYRRAWKELFLHHPEIRIVHGHMTSTASLYLPIAKSMGVKATIAHARSAGVDPGLKGRLTRILRKNLWKKCDYCFTCSRLAGESVFGKQAMEEGKPEFIPNAIQADLFAFDESARQRLRAELGISEDFVLGHVGRFSPVKNHEYLLEILEECIKKEKEKGLSAFKLMLLGEGPLQEKIRQQAGERGLTERVLFLGNQKEIYRFYPAMDFFLLPSFYEGLPGTAIEAQASGLRGIISDTITGEAIVTDLLRQLPITIPAEKWAEEILSVAAQMTGQAGKGWMASSEEGKINSQKGRTDSPEEGKTSPRKDRTGNPAGEKTSPRMSYVEKVRKAGYDVKEQAARLQAFYERI